MSMWDINLNAHYLFTLSDKVKVYPLAGISYTNWKFDDGGDDDYDYGGDDGGSTGKIGFNLGGGIQYDLTEKVFLNGEIKYQYIDHFDQLVFGVGIGYKF